MQIEVLAWPVNLLRINTNFWALFNLSITSIGTIPYLACPLVVTFVKFVYNYVITTYAFSFAWHKSSC